ncbi:MAG: sulfatase [Rikenellaceae bacterium]
MRPNYKKIISTSLILLPLFATAKAKEQPKKVIFIAVDDLNDWVGFLGGHPNTITPNMDKLASMGVVFENAYCAAPVSNASRTAMMTGIRSSSSGVYGNTEFLRDSPHIKDIATIPKYFSNNGYTSINLGKIFHHADGAWGDPQSWDYQKKLDRGGMFPKNYTKGVNCNGVEDSIVDWVKLDNDKTTTSDYKTCKWIAEQIVKEHDTPMFIGCGVFRPHLPWYVPKEYFDMHPLESIAEPLYNDFDVYDLPKSGLALTGYASSAHGYRAIKAAGKEKEAVQAYLACISYADDCLGEVVEAIENNPDKENTVIVFVSDHGWHLGEKMRYSKMSLWERSCRVPLIVIAPGVTTAGTRCKENVSLLDLYPTLVELASLPKNKLNEGCSLVAQLKNPDKKRDIPAITTIKQNSHSIKDGNYRYIIYADGGEELYDHQTDPNEWYNIANNPKYAKIKANLRKFIPEVNVPSIGKSKVPH